MKASDGDDWVWVMGDHPEDKSYDQICDGIMAQRAALQAQKEAEELRWVVMETIGKQMTTVKSAILIQYRHQYTSCQIPPIAPHGLLAVHLVYALSYSYKVLAL